MSVATWTNTCGIHHWRIIWSSYRKLAWVGFEPMITEFFSDALTDWAIYIDIYKYISSFETYYKEATIKITV